LLDGLGAIRVFTVNQRVSNSPSPSLC
jgi:hypothetical protein